jgi:hypothetical protein
MKSHCSRQIPFLLTIAAALLTNAAIGSEKHVEFGTLAGGRSLVSIEGTSTLHDWLVRGRLIEGTVVLPESLENLRNGASLSGVKAEVAVSAEALRSFKDGRPYSDRMDEIIREKLKVDEYPTIVFESKEVRRAQTSPDDVVASLEADGILRVAGVERPVTVPVEIRQTPRGPLRVTAKIDMKMTDFEITPPVALAGAIRTGDAITITVDWLVALKEQ